MITVGQIDFEPINQEVTENDGQHFPFGKLEDILWGRDQFCLIYIFLFCHLLWGGGTSKPDFGGKSFMQIFLFTEEFSYAEANLLQFPSLALMN